MLQPPLFRRFSPEARGCPVESCRRPTPAHHNAQRPGLNSLGRLNSIGHPRATAYSRVEGVVMRHCLVRICRSEHQSKINLQFIGRSLYHVAA